MLVLHLQLEEFRKKKAAAKKAAANNSAHSANGDLEQTKPPVSDSAQVTTDATPDSGSGFQVGNNENKTINILEAEPEVNPISSFNKPSPSPGPTYSTDGNLDHKTSYEVDVDKNKAFNHPVENFYSSYNHFSNIRQEDSFKNTRDERLKDFTSASPVTTQVSVTKPSPERSYGSLFAKNLSYNDLEPANGPTNRGIFFFLFLEQVNSNGGNFDHFTYI